MPERCPPLPDQIGPPSPSIYDSTGKVQDGDVIRFPDAGLEYVAYGVIPDRRRGGVNVLLRPMDQAQRT